MIPRLHLVTDEGLLRRSGFEEVARRLLAAGGPGIALHLRAPGTGGRLLWELTVRLLDAAERAGALLVVNDRVDVALIAGASTVHLPAHGLPVFEARELLGDGAQVGVSVHGELPGEAANRPDFVIAGTIYSTPSHPEREGSGVQRLERLVRARPGLPVLGIGGITPDLVPAVLGAGAHGVAVMRAVWEAGDPEDALGAFLTLLDEGTGTDGRSERDVQTEPTEEICHV